MKKTFLCFAWIIKSKGMAPLLGLLRHPLETSKGNIFRVEMVSVAQALQTALDTLIPSQLLALGPKGRQ